jgi:hypothetical protein
MWIVARLEDLIQEMRANPRNVRYADACRVADAFFGSPRQRGTSHRVWRMPWPGDPRVNLQEDKGGRAKAYQVGQIVEAIDRLRSEKAKRRTAERTGTQAKEKRAPKPRR